MRLIDADELYGRLAFDFEMLRNGALEKLTSDDILEAIHEQPTVDPVTHETAIDFLSEEGWLQEHDRILTESAVKHGRWIYSAGFDLDGVTYAGRYQCDQCNHWIDAGDDGNYCPNCGAHMMDGTQKKPCDDCQQFDCYGCEYAERNEDEAD